MSNNLVSVCIITYNHEKYISQAIESVLSQKTTFPIEIIIADDFSVDNTRNILKKYQEKYPNLIRLILNNKNLGATLNFYNLLNSANGKYIAQLEGDDYWITNKKLQFQYEFLEKNPDFIGHSHNKLHVDQNGNEMKFLNEKYKKVNLINWPIFSLEDCLLENLPGQTASLFYRNIFQDTLDENKILYEAHNLIGDFTLSILLTLKGNIYISEEYFSCYRLNTNLDSGSYNTWVKKNLRLASMDKSIYMLKLANFLEDRHISSTKIKLWKFKYFLILTKNSLISKKYYKLKMGLQILLKMNISNKHE